MKYEHPVLIKIHEMYSDLTRDGKEIVLVWFPGHVDISGNSEADSAAKDALDGDVSGEYISFSDLKPRLNSFITEVWKKKWDDSPLNKLHKISPKINEFLPPCRYNRRDEAVLSRLHVDHSYMTLCFLLKGADPPFCIPCEELLSLEHIALLRFN